MTESNAEMFQAIVKISFNGIKVETPRTRMTEERKKISEVHDNLLQ